MRVALTLVVAAVLAAVTASSQAAGGASLTITPTPVPLGSTFTLSGCGYPVPTSLSFEVVGPRKAATDIHYFTAGEPLTDPSGCFSENWTAWWSVTGEYQITSYYRDSHGSTRKAAVVKFTVT
jgi:hypothetical protein